MARDYQNDPIELDISTDTVCYIIAKAREFDVKGDPAELDPGANPIDEESEEILQDYPGDPTEDELREAIDDLNDDEVVELIALAWVGRGDFGPAEWNDAKALARDRHRSHSAAYLMGMPTLPDFLEEGLNALGHSCEPT